MSANDAAIIIEAANFAAIKHKNQKRKDPEGTPYINHPLGVAHILTSVRILDLKFIYYAKLRKLSPVAPSPPSPGVPLHRKLQLQMSLNRDNCKEVTLHIISAQLSPSRHRLTRIYVQMSRYLVCM